MGRRLVAEPDKFERFQPSVAGEEDELDVVAGFEVAGFGLDGQDRVAAEGRPVSLGGIDGEMDGWASALALPSDLEVVSLSAVDLDVGESAVGEEHLHKL